MRLWHGGWHPTGSSEDVLNEKPDLPQAPTMKGVGFRVGGLGLGVWGLGFGVWGLGLGAWGLGFGV